jgi:hypothetical protein
VDLRGLGVVPEATGMLVDKMVEGVVGMDCKGAEDVNVCEDVERGADDCEELIFAVEVTATGMVDAAEVVLAVVL